MKFIRLNSSYFLSKILLKPRPHIMSYVVEYCIQQNSYITHHLCHRGLYQEPFIYIILIEEIWGMDLCRPNNEWCKDGLLENGWRLTKYTLTSIISPLVMSLPLLYPQILGNGCAQSKSSSSLSYFPLKYHGFWHKIIHHEFKPCSCTHHIVNIVIIAMLTLCYSII